MLFSSQAQEQWDGVISLGDREAAFGKWIYTPTTLAVVVVDHNGPERGLNALGISIALYVVHHSATYRRIDKSFL